MSGEVFCTKTVLQHREGSSVDNRRGRNTVSHGRYVYTKIGVVG